MPGLTFVKRYSAVLAGILALIAGGVLVLRGQVPAWGYGAAPVSNDCFTGGISFSTTLLAGLGLALLGLIALTAGVAYRVGARAPREEAGSRAAVGS